MEIRNNSNVNFNGKLDIKAMKNEVPFWKNVKALVEKNTTDCPKDVFKLSEDSEGIVLETTRKGSDRNYWFSWENPSDLLNAGAETVAKKFGNFMRVFEKDSEIYDVTDSYIKKMKPLLEQDEFEKFETQVWDNAVESGFKTGEWVSSDDLFSKAVWDD